MAYKISEIFYSIQGEGARAGEPSLFVRMAGCPIGCSYCDEPEGPSKEMEAWQIVTELKRLSKWCKWVVVTGGEPALQYDDELAHNLRDEGYRIAIETSGAFPLKAPVDYLTISPKVSEAKLSKNFTRADELRYPMAHGDRIPRPSVSAGHLFLSPIFNGQHMDDDAVAWCVEMVKDNQFWRVSLQTHKLIGIR